MTAQTLPTISQRFGALTARISRRLTSQTWEVNVVDPASDPDWDGLVASHPGCSFFHSAAWAKVLCNTYAGFAGSVRRAIHGLPPQPISFFINIYDLIIKPGSGFVVLASRGKRAVAGAVFFHKGNKAIYKFGASDERLQHLRPNNLVLWEAISVLARHGFEKLHFGRTSLGNDGLRRFKLSWGTAEETINYFRFDTKSNECIVACDHVSGFHNTVFAKLPVALNRLMGALIYPHLD